jgi:hypothetical protein
MHMCKDKLIRQWRDKIVHSQVLHNNWAKEMK